MEEVEVTEVTQNGTVHNIESNTTFEIAQEWSSMYDRKRMTLVHNNERYTVEVRYGKLCFAPDRANINTFAEFAEE